MMRFCLLLFGGFLYLWLAAPLAAAHDSLRVNQYLDSAALYEISAPAEALNYYSKSITTARVSRFLKGEAKSWYYAAYVLQSMGENGRADSFFRQGLQVFEKLNDLPGMARSYNGIASCAQHSGDYGAAVRYFLLAAETLQGIPQQTEKHLRNLATIWFNVAVVFKKTENYSEARQYLESATRQFQSLNDTTSVADCYNNLGSLFGAMGDSVQEELYLRKAYNEIIHNAHAGNSIRSVVHVNMGVLAVRQGNWQSALQFYEKALTYARASSRYETVKVLYELALLYIRLNRWTDADTAQREILDYGEKNHSLSVLQDAWDLRSRIEAGQKNYAAALNAHQLYAAYRDSVMSGEQRKTVVELERQYQTAQKDKEILAKSTEIRKVYAWVAASVGAFLVTGLLVVLLWNRLRHRRILYAQEIKTLRQEEQLKQMQALITGEENERTRIARDLHDNIGGLLSAAKMHFQLLINKQPEPAENEDFQKTLTLLDHAAAEVRHTAHNLMPETLIRLGLQAALVQFCEKMAAAANLQIDVQVYGLEKKLSDSQNLLIYRMVQELVNNVLKHANATDALVQINRHDQWLSVTVEDNGKGFLPEELSGGMGLTSMEMRVQALSGKMEIQSVSGRGTSVFIQLPLSSNNEI